MLLQVYVTDRHPGPVYQRVTFTRRAVSLLNPEGRDTTGFGGIDTETMEFVWYTEGCSPLSRTRGWADPWR